MIQSYSDFLRSRMEHEYTAEEIDVLYSVIEEAACVAWLMRMYQEKKKKKKCWKNMTLIN